MDIAIYGTSEKNLQTCNPFIGISLSNKPLDQGHLLDVITWTTELDYVAMGIVIADEVNAINHKIFNKWKEDRAHAYALEEGKIWKSRLEELCSKHFPEHEISIYRWDDIKTPSYQQLLAVTMQEYQENSLFKSEIRQLVQEYLKRRPRSLAEDQLDYLSTYILAELPVLLEGITVNNSHYDMLVYPTFTNSTMTPLVQKIYAGNFPNIGDTLSREIVHANVLLD